MKRKTKKIPYSPRVQIMMNTGTRVMKSKKDKNLSRQQLSLKLRNGDFE